MPPTRGGVAAVTVVGFALLSVLPSLLALLFTRDAATPTVLSAIDHADTLADAHARALPALRRELAALGGTPQHLFDCRDLPASPDAALQLLALVERLAHLAPPVAAAAAPPAAPTTLAVSAHPEWRAAHARLARPRHKRVLAFALFDAGEHAFRPPTPAARAAFLAGLVANILLAPRVYPGWTVRVYAATAGLPPGFLALLRNFSHVELRLVGTPPVLPDCEVVAPTSGVVWRFLVADDPDVEYFLVRDTDSRLQFRERAAVDEFIRSGMALHTMNDHVMGHRTPLNAGMWGGVGMLVYKLTGGQLSMQALLERFLNDSVEPCGHGTDQTFLSEVLWPLAREHALCHSSASERTAACYGARHTRNYPHGHDLTRTWAHPLASAQRDLPPAADPERTRWGLQQPSLDPASRELAHLGMKLPATLQLDCRCVPYRFDHRLLNATFPTVHFQRATYRRSPTRRQVQPLTRVQVVVVRGARESEPPQQ